MIPPIAACKRINVLCSLIILWISVSLLCESATIPAYCKNIPDEDIPKISACVTAKPSVSNTEKPSQTDENVQIIDCDAIKEMGQECNLADLSKNIGQTNGKLFEGDIGGIDPEVGMASESPGQNNQANGIRDESKRWPKGVIPYTISKVFRPHEVQLIKEAMEVFHKETCIKFVPRNNEENFIYIYPGIGCSSNAGRIGSKQGVSLQIGACMKSGIIQHELMHTVGFYHEQSRTDRDNYVDINKDNIEPSALGQFKTYSNKEITAFNQPYDLGSVMHYGWNYFAKDSKVWTIRPKAGQKYEMAKLGQRERLSPIDITKINIMYKCPGSQVKSSDACPSTSGWTEHKGKCYFSSLKASERYDIKSIVSEGEVLALPPYGKVLTIVKENFDSEHSSIGVVHKGTCL